MTRFGKAVLILVGVGSLTLLPLLHGTALGADHPDDLYARGRYKEAEAAYQKLDMDHPADLRYRYDRGCAAYQGGNLDEARAAFSSTATRAKDSDVKARALYNLGTTALKKNDFEAARKAFTQALAAKPDDADARRNLEYTLREIKKQKEETQGQKQEGTQGKGSGKEKDKSGNDGRSGTGKDRQQGSQDRNGQQGGQNRGQPGGQQNPQPGGQQNGNGGQKQGQQPGPAAGSQGQHEGKQDLSGELKGRNMGSGNDASGNPRGMSPAAAMEKQRAEALLDNTKENRARARELKGSQGYIPPASGKEW